MSPIAWFVTGLVVFICGTTGGVVMVIVGAITETSSSSTPSSQQFIAVPCTVYRGWVSEVSDGDFSWYAVIYNASFPYSSETTVWGWLSNDTERFQTEGQASDVLASRPTLQPFTCYYDPKQLDFERNTNPIWAVNPKDGRHDPGDLDHSGAVALIVIGSIIMAASSAVFVVGMVHFTKRIKKGASGLLDQPAHDQQRISTSHHPSYLPPSKNEFQ